MAPLTMTIFERNDVMPSWWANAIQRAISTLSANVVVKYSDTVVTVPAGAGELAAILAIDGKWRWRESDVSRTHPGGAAGTYILWATARNNSIVDTPELGTDTTNYAFDLAFTSGYGTPPTAVPGTTEIWTHIAEVVWSGTKITKVTPTVRDISVTSTTWTTITNYTVRKTFDANDVTLEELANFVATMHEQLLRGGLRAA